MLVFFFALGKGNARSTLEMRAALLLALDLVAVTLEVPVFAFFAGRVPGLALGGSSGEACWEASLINCWAVGSGTNLCNEDSSIILIGTCENTPFLRIVNILKWISGHTI